AKLQAVGSSRGGAQVDTVVSFTAVQQARNEGVRSDKSEAVGKLTSRELAETTEVGGVDATLVESVHSPAVGNACSNQGVAVVFVCLIIFKVCDTQIRFRLGLASRFPGVCYPHQQIIDQGREI